MPQESRHPEPAQNQQVTEVGDAAFRLLRLLRWQTPGGNDYMNVGRLLGLFLCILALGVPAFADIQIDFSGPPSVGGAVSYNSGTGAFDSTTPTTINLLSGNGTPQNVGTYTVAQGGLIIHATGGSFNPVTGIYDFTGGTFAIQGGVPDIGIANGTTLLDGIIGDLEIFSKGQFIVNLVAAGGTDTKNAALVAFFCPTCLTTGWKFTGATTHLSGPTPGFSTGGSFTAGTFSTDVPNDYVPEPASILLLGTVMLGVTQLVRRRVG
jgi:hypothetical protein